MKHRLKKFTFENIKNIACENPVKYIPINWQGTMLDIALLEKPHIAHKMWVLDQLDHSICCEFKEWIDKDGVTWVTDYMYSLYSANFTQNELILFLLEHCK